MHDFRPDGYVKFDTSRCPAAVHNGGRSVGFHQCFNKPLAGERYCSAHKPENVAARQRANSNRYEEKQARERLNNLRWYGKPLIEALEQIADGHNDPRGLARDVLNTNGLSE